MKKSFNLSKVGLTLMAMDRAYYRARNVLDSSCVGITLPLSAGNTDRQAVDWKVQDTLERFPCYDPEVWAELLERTRRIHGELEKCEALISKARKSFPRNTTKEPL